MVPTKTVYYFEVSVSKAGGEPDRLFKLKDKCHWVRKGEPRDTYIEAQADAIANGERPYRIKREFVICTIPAPS